MKPISRRELLGGAAKVGLAGGAAAVAGGSLLAGCDSSGKPVRATTSFRTPARNKPGSPLPRRAGSCSSRSTCESKRNTDVRDLMRRWTDAIAAMTARPTGRRRRTARRVRGAGRHRRSRRFARGPSHGDGGLRRAACSSTTKAKTASGSRGSCPPELAELPTFKGDQLDPSRSGGDIGVQCCADDPQTAFHAFHTLARIARGTATVRWVQLGFGRTSSTSDDADRRRATSWASRTAPTTSRAKTTSRWRNTCGYRRTRSRCGCAAAVSWWCAASACRSRRGIARRSRSSRTRSGARSSRARRSAVCTSTTRRILPALPEDSHIRLAAPGRERRDPDPAARLQLRRRRRPEHRPARRGPVLHRVPARSAPAVRSAAETARRQRRVERVHQARRQRGVRGPARVSARRGRGADAVR